MQKNKSVVWILTTALLGVSSIAIAQEVFVFPKAGQSDEQMEEDKLQCHGWAVRQTKFDPFNAPQVSGASPAMVRATDEPLLNCNAYGAVQGAAGGAVGGYVTGAILGGSRKRGTNFGAITGAMSGAAKKNRCESENSAKQSRNAQRRALLENEAPTSSAGSRDDYVRAYKTCLSAKDYAAS